MRPIKRYQRVVINRKIARNRDLIVASAFAEPEQFAQREHLYMRHHELLAEREACQ